VIGRRHHISPTPADSWPTSHFHLDAALVREEILTLCKRYFDIGGVALVMVSLHLGEHYYENWEREFTVCRWNGETCVLV
jgi:hypothetical protein